MATLANFIFWTIIVLGSIYLILATILAIAMEFEHFSKPKSLRPVVTLRNRVRTYVLGPSIVFWVFIQIFAFFIPMMRRK